MNDKIWNIETLTKSVTVTCETCGVAQDGSLLCFIVENGQPMVICGYAPGQWLKFQKSSLRMN